jgi:hypothetical protein
MVFIVWVTEHRIGHVFTELSQMLEHLKIGARHQRIEIWNKSQLRGVHY